MRRMPLLSVCASIVALAPVSYILYQVYDKTPLSVKPPETRQSSRVHRPFQTPAPTQLQTQRMMQESMLRALTSTRHKPAPSIAHKTAAPAPPKGMKVGQVKQTHQVVHHTVSSAAPPLAAAVPKGPKVSLAPVKTVISSAPPVSSPTGDSTPSSTGNSTGNATASPPPAAPSAPPLPALPWRTVFGYVTSASSLVDAEDHAVNEIAADTFSINADGSLSGTDLSGVQSYEDTTQHVAYAVAADFGPATDTVLGSAASTKALISNLVSLAVTHNYSGISLDTESVSPADRQLFNNFVAALESSLHAHGKRLSIAVPAESGYETWWDGYDYAAIGAHVDQMVLMTYDYSWSGSPPGAIAPLWWVQNVVQYAVKQVPPQKLLLGIGAYGYDWTNDQAPGKALGLGQVDALIAQYHAGPMWDSGDSVPYFTYQDASGNAHEVYYEDQTSIGDKLALAKQYGLGGISVWRMGLEDTAAWNALNPYASGN